MKEIPLTKEQTAFVDDSDYPAVSRHSWIVGKRGYPVASIKVNDRWTSVTLHHFLLPRKKNRFIDHANCNRFDNRRANLRYCTLKQNGYNHAGHPKNRVSPYKGVSLISGNKFKKWRARITKDGVTKLKSFYAMDDAARQYDVWAKELFSKFAWLNFP